MTNSNTSDVNALSAVSGSFYKWLEDDVVDTIAGVVMSIIFVVGMILNIIVIRVLSSNYHMTMTSKPVFVQLIAIDFVTYCFIILPGIVSAFKDSITFPDALCVINGLFIMICFLASFFFMTILCCERAIRLWKPTLHEKIFEKRRYCFLIVIAVWLVCAIASALPFTGYGQVEHIPLQQRCVLHGGNQIHIHLLFVFGIYIPSVAVCICGVFTYNRKRQIVFSLSKINKQVEMINLKLAKRTEESKTLSATGRRFNEQTNLCVSEMVEGSANSCHTISQSVMIPGDTSVLEKQHNVKPDDINHILPDDTFNHKLTHDIEAGVGQNVVGGPMTSRSENDTKRDILCRGVTGDETKLSKVKVMFTVYESSSEERDVTLAVSYILMFIVVMGLWLPYVVLSYADGDHNTLWGGWFTLVGMVSDISYCIKPVVYLSHNKVLKRAAMASFPESVKKRAAKTQEALLKIGKKLDSLVFIQIPDTKSLIDIERDRVRVSPTTN
ncbi:uncharacterized protein LOC132546213 [Ylistrum balloti]|uniref:uncharacterized protein LOC132546213 n=1 Tax=Ylistrum balloti TaxID=509963 RepID=UPI002905D281|nr:uncharacterized protein LOC132546213 [Ylistrum balloti]